MSVLGQGDAQRKPSARDIVNRQKRKNAAELVLDAGLFSEEVICALIDEWIVPSVVERMISSISNPSSTPKG
jgi:hypothetical protein